MNGLLFLSGPGRRGWQDGHFGTIRPFTRHALVRITQICHREHPALQTQPGRDDERRLPGRRPSWMRGWELGPPDL